MIFLFYLMYSTIIVFLNVKGKRKKKKEKGHFIIFIHSYYLQWMIVKQ